jgi:hypothetical protein
MSEQELLQWKESEGIGSADYFGGYMKLLREYKGFDLSTWSGLAQVDPEIYRQLEAGTLTNPPALDDLNTWVGKLPMTRDEIIDMKMSGGYDISAYLQDPSTEDMGRAIADLLQIEPRFPIVRLAGDLITGFINSRLNKKP